MARCPRWFMRIKARKTTYRTGAPRKVGQARFLRKVSRKYKLPHVCECSIVGKCTRLIIERSLVQVQSFAPPERKLRRLTSTKYAFVIRRTCRAIIDKSPFYGSVVQLVERQTVNLCLRGFESLHSRHILYTMLYIKTRRKVLSFFYFMRSQRNW